MPVYVASKYSVVGYTKSVAVRLSSKVHLIEAIYLIIETLCVTLCTPNILTITFLLLQMDPDISRTGMRYLCLCPGFTDTSMFTKDNDVGFGKEQAEQLVTSVGVNT